ncbi:MAG: 30S ribosomal protein S3 [Candidatus Shikimatogenerans sp. Ttur]|uniref:Small ribosomal subunit protein uS3 n=1 Tax=Candidatus Shikimatogenerans sp. Ttur TaxID=3158569 RepID=A0AAU7ZYF2_9FLAO
MGHKINPLSNRLGIIFNWKSSWVNNYKKNIYEDYNIRKLINSQKYKYYISCIYIERFKKKINIIISTSRPAMLIGKLGKKIKEIKKKIEKLLLKKYIVFLNIKEIKELQDSSLLVAKNIALQLEQKRPYKKVIKYMINFLFKKNISGIKIKISGRLNGNEIARSEFFQKGIIKSSTFRANIDYDLYEMLTKYGIISIKVWIMKGELYKI